MKPLTVGELLIEELRARQWTQDAFAKLLGRPPQWLSEVVNGKKSLTPRSAAQVAAALGTSAELWLWIQARRALDELARDDAFCQHLGMVKRRVEDLSRAKDGAR